MICRTRRHILQNLYRRQECSSSCHKKHEPNMVVHQDQKNNDLCSPICEGFLALFFFRAFLMDDKHRGGQFFKRRWGEKKHSFCLLEVRCCRWDENAFRPFFWFQDNNHNTVIVVLRQKNGQKAFSSHLQHLTLREETLIVVLIEDHLVSLH